MPEQLSAAELEALRGFSTPTILNAIETFNVRPADEGFMDRSIVCRFPELGRMAGYAVTARIRASSADSPAVDHRDVWRVFDDVPKPWVLVIDDLDAPYSIGSYWGEVNAATYAALGAVGAVTNGGVRDLAEVRPTGFHFFSAHVLVSHAYVRVVEAGAPVRVGGLSVSPGDLIHGDEHGVAAIPFSIARSLAHACRRVEDSEQELIRYARSGDVEPERLASLYDMLIAGAADAVP